MRPGSIFPSGPGHVINILMSVLPGIDCNDIKKTMVVFQLISIYGRLVPIMDLSEFATSRNRVATKSFEGFGEALFEDFIMGWEPVSIVHYTRPGTCINHPLH